MNKVTLAVLVCSLFANLYLLFFYSRVKRENRSLNSMLRHSWKEEQLLIRDFLLNLSPSKVRYLTREEALKFYDFHHSVAQEDTGPTSDLYIINPSEEELARIKQFCNLVGCMVTWPLSRAPYYIIPGDMTEEEKHRYVYHRPSTT